MKKLKYIIVVVVMIFSISTCDNEIEFKGNQYILDTSLPDMPITLVFDKNRNQYHGKALNSYFGTYKVMGNNLFFEMGGITKMNGNVKKMDIEDEYIQNLQNVVSFKITEEGMILLLKNGKQLNFEKRKILEIE